MKVYDTINPREGCEVGDVEGPVEAFKLLQAYFEGTGEDRLCGVCLADFDQEWQGEVFVPCLMGINESQNLLSQTVSD